MFPFYCPGEDLSSKKNQIRKWYRGEGLWICVLAFCSPLGFDEMDAKLLKVQEGLTQEFGKQTWLMKRTVGLEYHYKEADIVEAVKEAVYCLTLIPGYTENRCACRS